MKTMTGAAIASVLVAAVSACGGSNAPKQNGINASRFSGGKKAAAAVVDELQAASRSGDTKAICNEVFSPQLASRVAGQAGTTCEARVGKKLIGRRVTIIVQTLAITGKDTAVAQVVQRGGQRSRLQLARRDGRWQVDNIVALAPASG